MLKDASPALFFPLDGLDSDAARNILTGFEDLSTEQWLHIHGLSRGHPLVLELINRGASAGASTIRSNTMLRKRFFQTIC